MGKRRNKLFLVIVVYLIFLVGSNASLLISVKSLLKKVIGAKFLQIYHNIKSLKSERDINLPQTCLSLYISILKDKVFRLEP